jgi:hypothetical protein
MDDPNALEKAHSAKPTLPPEGTDIRIYRGRWCFNHIFRNMTRRMVLLPDCAHHLLCQLRAPLPQASLRERALRSHLHLEANTGLCKYCLQQTPRNQTQLRCRYRSLLVECKIRTRRGLCVTAYRKTHPYRHDFSSIKAHNRHYHDLHTENTRPERLPQLLRHRSRAPAPTPAPILSHALALSVCCSH